jgi:hypothetical protein
MRGATAVIEAVAIARLAAIEAQYDNNELAGTFYRYRSAPCVHVHECVGRRGDHRQATHDRDHE